MTLDPDPLSVREDELVERQLSARELIRRARPRVDSPLAELISGKITQAEYARRRAEGEALDPRQFRHAHRRRILRPVHVVFAGLLGLALGLLIRGMVG